MTARLNLQAKSVEDKAQEYIPVLLETICQGSEPDFDLYLRNSNQNHVLFSASHARISSQKLQTLVSHGQRVLYISPDKAREYRRYVADNLEMVLNDETVSIDRKADIVYSTAASLMEDVLDNPGSEENLRRATSVARHAVSLVEEADSVENILAMTSFDYTTHTHSVNVCVYGLSLAKFIGLRDSDILRDLGTGLLLHDVGKAEVDQEILNKPSRLTPEEFEHMKAHPNFGENILLKRENIPAAAVVIASQHHERVDGKGYPRALGSSEIHEFARLAAVLDVFDALTTRRPYKEPLPTFDALQLMKADTGHFDEQILTALIKMLTSGTRLKT